MKDFLRFRKMITPIIIQILFWLGSAACVVAGLLTITTGGSLGDSVGLSSSPLPGLLMIVLGPLLVRIYCELMIVLFRIHQSLMDIRSSVLARPGGPANL